MRILFIFVMTFLISGCGTLSIRPPEKMAPSSVEDNIGTSFIKLPITIRTNDLEQKVLEEGSKKPLSIGRSEEISANLLVEEETTETRIVKTLIRVAVPGHTIIEKVPKTITKHVKVATETYKCLLRPWKWGHCVKDVFKDVTETVWEDTKVTVEATAEEFKDIAQPFIIIKEKIAPTSIWLNHRVDLRGVALDFQGNNFTGIFSINGNANVDVKQGLLGAKVLAKGALSCDGDFELNMNGTFNITDKAEVEIKIKDKPVLEVKKLCTIGAVETFNVMKYMEPQLLVGNEVLKKVIGEKIKSVLNKSIEEAIQKNGLHAQVDNVMDKFSGSIALSKNKDIWLSPRVEKLIVGPILGAGTDDNNYIQASAAFLARPLVTVTEKVDQIEKTKPVILEYGTFGNYTYLSVQGRVPLEEGAKRLEKELKKLYDSKLSNFPYIPGNVVAYGSDKELVLAIEIINKKSGALKAISYVTGKPVYDEKTKEIFLEDINFTTETRNVLIKVVNWLFDSKLEKIISEQARWNVGDQLSKAYEAIKDINVNTDFGTLKGHFEPIKIGQPLISQTALHIFAETHGELNFVSHK